MAELEQKHRHLVTERTLATQTRMLIGGMVSALVIGLSGIVGGFVLALKDKPLVGLTAFSGTLLPQVKTAPAPPFSNVSCKALV
jgi:uncharacterized membrane protein